MKIRASIPLEDLVLTFNYLAGPGIHTSLPEPRSVIQEWVGLRGLTTPWGTALAQTMASKLDKMQKKTGCFKSHQSFRLEEVVRELL